MSTKKGLVSIDRIATKFDGGVKNAFYLAMLFQDVTQYLPHLE